MKAHGAMTCSEHFKILKLPEPEQEFQMMSKQFTYKQCPRCKIMTERKNGCPHMTCACDY